MLATQVDQWGFFYADEANKWKYEWGLLGWLWRVVVALMATGAAALTVLCCIY